MAPEPIGSVALSDALMAIGDQRSLEIIRAIFGRTYRFARLRTELEVADPVLAKRLRLLTTSGVLRQHQYSTNPPRHEYHLTTMGLDLWRVFVALWVWDEHWSADTAVNGLGDVLHETCGRRVVPVFGCANCDAIGITPRDTRATVDQQLAIDVVGQRARRGVRTDLRIGNSAISMLGDSWTTALMAGGMLGVRRFGDFRDRMPGISPVTLTDRLAQLISAGVMERTPVTVGGRRMEYRLTPKGRDYFPIFCTLNAWAQMHFSGDGRSGLQIVHRFCGGELQPRYTCNGCNKELTRRDIDLVTRSS